MIRVDDYLLEVGCVVGLLVDELIDERPKKKKDLVSLHEKLEGWLRKRELLSPCYELPMSLNSSAQYTGEQLHWFYNHFFFKIFLTAKK